MSQLYAVPPSNISKLRSILSSIEGAEEKHLVLNAAMSAMMDADYVALWAWHTSTNHFYFNKYLLDLCGIKDDRLAYHDLDYFLHYIHPEDRSKVKKSLNESYRNKTNYKQSFRVCRSDGLKTISSKGRVVNISSGPVVAGICEDAEIAICTSDVECRYKIFLKDR
jgi:PAS domain-containing protein